MLKSGVDPVSEIVDSTLSDTSEFAIVESVRRGKRTFADIIKPMVAGL
jgi:hypothetical protein